MAFWPGLDFEQAGAGNLSCSLEACSKTVGDILKLSFNFFFFGTVQLKIKKFQLIPILPQCWHGSLNATNINQRHQQRLRMPRISPNRDYSLTRQPKTLLSLRPNGFRHQHQVCDRMSGSICATTTTVSP